MTASDHLSEAQFYHYGSDPMEHTGFVHVGTRAAAESRGGGDRALYEVHIAPQRALGSPSQPLDDWTANRIGMHSETRDWLGRDPGSEDFDPDFEDAPDVAHEAGWTPHTDAVYYRNDIEDRGSLSAMVKRSAITRAHKISGQD